MFTKQQISVCALLLSIAHGIHSSSEGSDKESLLRAQEEDRYRHHVIGLFKEGKLTDITSHFDLTYEQRLAILNEPFVDTAFQKHFLSTGMYFCLQQYPDKQNLCTEFIKAHAACAKKYIAENHPRAMFAFPLESLEIFVFEQLSGIHNRIKRLEEASTTKNQGPIH